MVFQLKSYQEYSKGIIVFSHKEYLRIFNSKYSLKFLNKLKKKYFIGIHWGASFEKMSDKQIIDMHFYHKGMLPQNKNFEDKAINLTTRNFTPDIFYKNTDLITKKKWDVITIGRMVKVKKYLDFFLIIKNVLIEKPNTKILIIAPEIGYKKSTHDFLFYDNFDKIFTIKEKSQIDLITNKEYFSQNKVIEYLKQSNIFLFTSIKEGVAKVTAEAALCGLHILIYKKFIGAAHYGIDQRQLNYYSSHRDASDQIINLLQKDKEIYDNSELKESYSKLSLVNELKKFFRQHGENFSEEDIDIQDLSIKLNSFQKFLPKEITLPETNDLKNYRSLLVFYKMINIQTNTVDYLLLTTLDFLFFLKNSMKKWKNLIPLFFWIRFRRKNQYKATIPSG